MYAYLFSSRSSVAYCKLWTSVSPIRHLWCINLFHELCVLLVSISGPVWTMVNSFGWGSCQGLAMITKLRKKPNFGHRFGGCHQFNQAMYSRMYLSTGMYSYVLVLAAHHHSQPAAHAARSVGGITAKVGGAITVMLCFGFPFYESLLIV